MKRRQKGSGSVRQLPSGRWQARYRDEDDALHSAPKTFDTKMDAAAWLKAGDFSQPDTVLTADPSLTAYSAAWLVGRDDIKPRTRAHYAKLLEAVVVPGLGKLRLSQITPASVRAWHSSLDASKPTMRAHAYSLLREVLATAVMDELLVANPCRIRKAGQAKTRHTPRPAELKELDQIVEALPDRYRAMILLAAWCGLRFGELTELRRRDLDGATIHIRRGVVRVDGGYLVGDPKSRAGKRSVAMPPHLVPILALHLRKHVKPSADALLFPAATHDGHMAPSSLYKVWYPARKAAGRDDLHFHDLRHTGASLAAATGATLADLMVRIGHSTPAAAMRYQHALQGRDDAIAEELSRFAKDGAVSLKSAPAKTSTKPR